MGTSRTLSWQNIGKWCSNGNEELRAADVSVSEVSLQRAHRGFCACMRLFSTGMLMLKGIVVTAKCATRALDTCARGDISVSPRRVGESRIYFIGLQERLSNLASACEIRIFLEIVMMPYYVFAYPAL